MASGVRIFSRVRIVSLTGMVWAVTMTIIDEENRDSSRGQLHIMARSIHLSALI